MLILEPTEGGSIGALLDALIAAATDILERRAARQQAEPRPSRQTATQHRPWRLFATHRIVV